jgi:hypothetical protein
VETIASFSFILRQDAHPDEDVGRSDEDAQKNTDETGMCEYFSKSCYLPWLRAPYSDSLVPFLYLLTNQKD